MKELKGRSEIYNVGSRHSDQSSLSIRTQETNSVTEWSRKQITQFRGFCGAGNHYWGLRPTACCCGKSHDCQGQPKRKEELEAKESLQPRQKSTLPARRTVALDWHYLWYGTPPIHYQETTTLQAEEVVRGPPVEDTMLLDSAKDIIGVQRKVVTEKKLSSSIPVYIVESIQAPINLEKPPEKE